MFQGVHETICFGPAATGWGEGEAPLNQIVFIGRNLARRVSGCCGVCECWCVFVRGGARAEAPLRVSGGGGRGACLCVRRGGGGGPGLWVGGGSQARAGCVCWLAHALARGRCCRCPCCCCCCPSRCSPHIHPLTLTPALSPTPRPHPPHPLHPAHPPPPPHVQDLAEGFRSCVWTPLPEGWEEHLDPRTQQVCGCGGGWVGGVGGWAGGRGKLCSHIGPHTRPPTHTHPATPPPPSPPSPRQPYFVNRTTGAKQWDRPPYACALVNSTETSHQQPTGLQPRRSVEDDEARPPAEA